MRVWDCGIKHCFLQPSVFEIPIKTFPVWTFSINTFHFLHCPGEADSHRYGNSNDSCCVSWPGPPWLQQHVRLTSGSVGVLTDRAMQMPIDPSVFWHPSAQHCCQWTVKLVQDGESSGMKTRWLRLSCCLSLREGEDLLSVKLYGNTVNEFTHLCRLSGTKSMPAQSWQCATTTSPRWRTITVLLPSRSSLFLSAISLQTWIQRHSNRSDRWDVECKALAGVVLS